MFPSTILRWHADIDPEYIMDASAYLIHVDCEMTKRECQKTGNERGRYDGMGGYTHRFQKCSVRSGGRIDGVSTGYKSEHGGGSGDYLIQYRAHGVIPVFRGKAPVGAHWRGFPYKDEDTWQIMANLRKDVRAGRILLAPTAPIGEEDAIMCTPSMQTAKKSPDRAMSQDKRLISDARLVNARCDKYDYPPVETPRLGSVITHVWRLKRHYHGAPVNIAKRDVDSAFERISARPDTCVISATEFSGKWLILPAISL